MHVKLWEDIHVYANTISLLSHAHPQRGKDAKKDGMGRDVKGSRT